MKTLKKIQLKDAAVLSHYQLKQIRGGSGGGSGSNGENCYLQCGSYGFYLTKCPADKESALAACGDDRDQNFAPSCNFGASSYEECKG